MLYHGCLIPTLAVITRNNTASSAHNTKQEHFIRLVMTSLPVEMYSRDGTDVILGASKIKCLFCRFFHLIHILN